MLRLLRCCVIYCTLCVSVLLCAQDFNVEQEFAKAREFIQQQHGVIGVSKNVILETRAGGKALVLSYTPRGPKVQLRMNGGGSMQLPMKWAIFKPESIALNVLKYGHIKGESLMHLLVIFKVTGDREHSGEVMRRIKDARDEILLERSLIIETALSESQLSKSKYRKKGSRSRTKTLSRKKKVKILNAHYYMAPNGNDQNPGTINRPFATLARGLERLKPGQLLYVRGGTYFPKKTIRFKKAGTADAWFHVHAYPGEVPIFDATQLQTSGALNATWHFHHAKYWKIKGHIHLTQGRGPGLFVDNESQFLKFDRIESSYNGQQAARGGHGFMVIGRNISDVLFRNCDGHHNANHLTKPGENVQENLYQHGDGFRIFEAKNVKLIDCRAWYNLDDGYDTTQAVSPIEMVGCWAAYSGTDDVKGSITGTPNRRMSKWEGDGIKTGYKSDVGRHRIIRCLSWANMCHGFNIQGGPIQLYNSVSFNNKEAAFFGEDNQKNDIQNTYEFKNKSARGGVSRKRLIYTFVPGDFITLNDAGMLGPRQSDGSLPKTGFLRPGRGSRLIDSGVDVGISFEGRAPDLSAYEYEKK